MGVLVKEKCFTSNALALDYYFSAIPPSLSNGSYTSFQKFGSTWRIVVSNPSTPYYASTYPAPYPNFPVCDENLPFFDGLTLGWAVATVMVIAWAFSQIRKAAR